ncbi:type II secretion system protein [Denitrobacterium detoxificans]|jgi:type II secretory pathway pseudopilin PulG|uniref:type II secretion system protein n=1 Tax=Denitrobacterium detoxificans TaxID=79604 RepID=UPI0026EAD024|nr:hypothetical protein [Denitrobacterium detoxificans]MBE6466189.1 hypothetical protein [Denitrobacterium detoxificans]
MYHEQTYASLRKRRIHRIVAVAIVVILAALVAFSVQLAQQNARTQAAASLRNAILNSAKECCAVEGSYPSSLSHLEDAYGLTINHNDYVVTYEWFADNVLPSVVVVPR